jgi:hypothetical protein
LGFVGQQSVGSDVQLPQTQDENDESPLSPGAMDFVVYGGVILDSPKGVPTQAALPLVVEQHKPEMMHVSPYHGAALSLFNHIHLASLSSLDLNLDLALPHYLSLSTVIDITKLIKDDEYSFQDTRKELLLECMDTLEAEDEELQGQTAVMDTKDQPWKKRSKRTAGHLDVNSLHRITRVNKGGDGFKDYASPLKQMPTFMWEDLIVRPL